MTVPPKIATVSEYLITPPLIIRLRMLSVPQGCGDCSICCLSSELPKTRDFHSRPENLHNCEPHVIAFAFRSFNECGPQSSKFAIFVPWRKAIIRRQTIINMQPITPLLNKDMFARLDDAWIVERSGQNAHLASVRPSKAKSAAAGRTESTLDPWGRFIDRWLFTKPSDVAGIKQHESYES